MAWESSVLVVAHQTADSDELLDALRGRAADGAARFTLLVPARKVGRAGREEAGAQLDAALERMRGAGLKVEGEVGDSDPVNAVHGIWDPARFDEIFISTLPTDTSRWLEINLPHRVERMTGVPVHHVMASRRRQPTPEPVPPRESLGVLSPLAPLGWGEQRAHTGGGEGAAGGAGRD
jgi:hypothetical protein